MKKQFGYRLCSALALRGVLQKELAKELGVKDNVISYYCSGARVPKLEQVITISRFLNVSADYLLGLSGVPSVNADLRTAETVTGLNEKSIKAIQAIGTEIVNEAFGTLAIYDFFDSLKGMRITIDMAKDTHKKTGRYDEIEIKFMKLAYLDAVEIFPRLIEEMFAYRDILNYAEHEDSWEWEDEKDWGQDDGDNQADGD